MAPRIPRRRCLGSGIPAGILFPGGGLEPDRCFYIRNLFAVQGKLEIDLNRDLRPDLAIEIDIMSCCLDRLAIYAALGVPECCASMGKFTWFFPTRNPEEPRNYPQRGQTP